LYEADTHLQVFEKYKLLYVYKFLYIRSHKARLQDMQKSILDHNTTTTMDLSSPQLVLPVAALLVPFFYFFIKYKRSQSLFLPVKWPIVGILPAILANLNNAHDYITLVALSFPPRAATSRCTGHS
jgi:hypothetical protein